MKYLGLLLFTVAIMSSCTKECSDVTVNGRLIMDIPAAELHCGTFDDGIRNDNHESGRNYFIVDVATNKKIPIVGQQANDIIGRTAPGSLVTTQGMLCGDELEIYNIAIAAEFDGELIDIEFDDNK